MPTMPARPRVFTTVGLPDRQRVPLWERHNEAALIGLRCRSLRTEMLEATEINLQLDRVHLARVRGTSHVVERNEELVRASPTESVFLSFSLVGETFLYHEDAVWSLRPGQLVICDADRPFMRGFSQGLEELVLKIHASFSVRSPISASLIGPSCGTSATANSRSHMPWRDVWVRP